MNRGHGFRAEDRIEETEERVQSQRTKDMDRGPGLETEYGLKDKGPGSRRGHESRPDERVQE
jgi:hypothetical protein